MVNEQQPEGAVGNQILGPGQQMQELRQQYPQHNLNDQPDQEEENQAAENEFEQVDELNGDADGLVDNDAVDPFYGPHLPVQEQNQAAGLGRIEEREEQEDHTETEAQMAPIGGNQDNQLNPLGLSFGPDLQQFDRLELNSISGHENSQMHNSPGKFSALSRSRSKRIAKTKTKLPQPTKKLSFDEEK